MTDAGCKMCWWKSEILVTAFLFSKSQQYNAKVSSRHSAALFCYICCISDRLTVTIIKVTKIRFQSTSLSLCTGPNNFTDLSDFHSVLPEVQNRSLSRSPKSTFLDFLKCIFLRFYPRKSNFKREMKKRKKE